MARTKGISTLKQLRSALRTMTLSEFMQLSPHGRSAYGALYDELEADYGEDAPALPAPDPEPKRLPSRPPVQGSLYPQSPSLPPANSMPPAPGAWFKMRPLDGDQEPKPWARALSIMGVDEEVANDVLLGGREFWATDGSLHTLRNCGFQFETVSGPEKQANVGHDMYVS